MSNRYIITQSSSSIDKYANSIKESLAETEMLILLAAFSFLIVFNLFMGGNRKGVLANARFGGRVEKFNALRLAQKQKQKGDKAKTALYAGERLMSGWKPQMQTLLTGNSPALALPNLNQHVAIMGTTGFGKTTTIGNRAIQDGIRDGHPIIVFDPKGELAQINAPYAKAHDYQAYYLKPGGKHTDCFNVVEWMRSSKDSTRAQQIAKTIQANANPKGVAKSNDFFSDSGEVLIRSVLMLTKASDYPDLLMAKRILALPELCQRIQDSYKSGRLNPWIENSFQQFMAGQDAKKTIAGIAATAGLVFDGFTQEEFYNAFIGKSTMTMDFTGKKILFVQPPMEQEDVVMPILTTVVEILVEENMSKPREEPLLLFLEEFPIAYWRKVERWMSFRRSNGLAVFLIAQLWAQIRKKYGEDEAKSILANANTQIYFNCNDVETARMVSSRCGEKEVKVKQKSRSSGKQGNSNSTSEQLQKVPLMTHDEFLQMEESEFVMFNTGHGARGKTSVPIRMKYRIPQEELDRDKQMETAWFEYIYPERCEEAKEWHLDEDQREAALLKRGHAAEEYLPLKEQGESEDSQADRANTDQGILAHQNKEFTTYV